MDITSQHPINYLVSCEALYNPGGLRIQVQVLVRGEEPLAVDEVDIVLVVKLVGGADIEGGGVGGGGGRASKAEGVGEVRVEGRVLGRVEAA